MRTHRVPSRFAPLISIALATASGALAIASDVPAQSPLPAAATGSIDWPATGCTPARAVSGDFTGDHDTDVVFLAAGGGATLVYGPGVYSAFVPLASDVRDAARLRGAAGTADRLLVVDGTGLRLLSDYDAGAFTATTVLAGAPWSTAKRVLTGHVNADAFTDAVGLAADGRTILVVSDVAGASPATSSFTLAYDVHDLCIAEWSPEPAIVAISAGGIHVRRAGGATIVEYVGGTFASGAVAVLEQSNLAHQRVAFVYAVPGLGDWLGVVDKNGPAQNTSLGAIGAYALASGDADEDGLDDLVVLQRAQHHALHLRNQGGTGAPFGSGELIDLGLGTQAAPAQTAAPVLTDLTNDTDLDLLVHVAATGVLAVFENASTPHANVSPVVDAGSYAYSFLALSGDVHFEVLPGITAHPFVPTGVEFSVWAEDLSGTSATSLHQGYATLDGQGRAHPTFTIEELDVATSRKYHVAMKAVRVVGGTTLGAGPTAVWSFATPTQAVLELEALSGNEGVPLRIFLVDQQQYMTAADEAERILTPSGVPQTKVPPIDEPPDPFEDP